MGRHTTEVVMKFTDQFTSGFEKSIKQIQAGTLVSKKAIRELNATGTTLIKTGAMMFVPLVAGIKQCLQAEIEYENAVAKVKTIANENQKSMDVVGKEMRQISKTYGQGIDSVADTFYDVISATVDTANALDYVNVASQMAIGGFADMKTAVGGLTTSMAAYKDKGYDMYRIGDILAQTQVYGKTTINELAQSLGQVVPYTSSVGLSFEDLGTAMAVLTSNGLDTSMAAITLKNAINSILKPSSMAQKAFESLGVAYGSNAFKDTSFGEYLEQIRTAIGLSDKAKEGLKELMQNKDVTDEELTDFYSKAGVNVDALLTMFKNIRGATAMISLTNSIDKYQNFREQMNEENSKGVLEKQANIMLQSPEMQFKILRENFNDSLRQFGVKLMPKLNQFLGLANDLLIKLNSMSDEQISQLVDNTIKIAGASAGLIVLGTLAKAVASIATFLNLIWKPIAKFAFKGSVKNVATGLGGATGTAAGIGTVLSKAIFNPVTAAITGLTIGNKLSETKIGDDSLSKYGPIYYDDPEAMEKIAEKMQANNITNNSYEIYDPKTNKFTTVNNNVSNKNITNKNVTNNETNNTVNESKPDHIVYDPKTNKFTNVYISNVNVSGVEDLDGIISEIENAADNMK